MTPGAGMECRDLGDLADYWTSDLPLDETARIEAHVFECAACARRLAETRTLADGIAELVRGGRCQAIVTDDVLNRLAREGVRVRSYVLEPDAVVPCAIWEDDEVAITRLRADFSRCAVVSVVTELEPGEELDRVAGIPVHAGTREIIAAFSAARLRALPRRRIRLTLSGAPAEGAAEEPIARYTLDHAGPVGPR